MQRVRMCFLFLQIWETALSMQKSADALLFVNMGDDVIHAKKVEAFLFANQGIYCTSCKESGGSSILLPLHISCIWRESLGGFKSMERKLTGSQCVRVL